MKKPGCPTFGNLVGFRSLQHEPLNEQGVVFVFGMVAEELGFRVKLVRNEFPDCIADQRIGNGRWQEVKIEFEFESRTFAEHGHDL
ncbi:MAG: hypothetical protein KJ052_22300, partial [Candidatus Hydrogenedentes bacterium]|nr:hypothetical protein [Candidatus Hydrogenedentota bacterium]